jgi:hypothetical protein
MPEKNHEQTSSRRCLVLVSQLTFRSGTTCCLEAWFDRIHVICTALVQLAVWRPDSTARPWYKHNVIIALPRSFFVGSRTKHVSDPHKMCTICTCAASCVIPHNQTTHCYLPGPSSTLATSKIMHKMSQTVCYCTSRHKSVLHKYLTEHWEIFYENGREFLFLPCSHNIHCQWL